MIEMRGYIMAVPTRTRQNRTEQNRKEQNINMKHRIYNSCYPSVWALCSCFSCNVTSQRTDTRRLPIALDGRLLLVSFRVSLHLESVFMRLVIVLLVV